MYRVHSRRLLSFFVVISLSLLLCLPSYAEAPEFTFRGVPLGQPLVVFRNTLASEICPQSFEEKDYAFESSIRETSYISYYSDDYLFFDTASAFGEDYTFYQMRLFPEDGETVAGYEDFFVLAYAIPSVSNGVILDTPKGSIVINALYAIHYEGNENGKIIREDILNKLTQLYGECSDFSVLDGSCTYIWYGANNTYLKFTCFDFSDKSTGDVRIEYGLTNAPELLDAIKYATQYAVDPYNNTGL